ncbi:MAG: hypothetical protein AB1547_09730 [Thermodesulfobacteriota bacterium]
MNRVGWYIGLAWVGLQLIVGSHQAFAIREADIQRLTAAGIDGAALAAIVEEKVIETVAFTVDELIALKKQARLSNETIRLLVKERSFLKNREPVVYGKEVQPIRLSTVDDILALKKAGMSDDVIQAIILVSSESTQARDRDRAWRMLEQMGIVIDGR